MGTKTPREKITRDGVLCRNLPGSLHIRRSRRQEHQQHSDSFLKLWNVAASALFIIAARMVNIGRTTLTIKPQEGIVFNGKKLPFKDIQSIGTVHETTGNNPKGNGYVSAQSHGTEIKVTRYVRKDLADALAAEIRGGCWQGLGVNARCCTVSQIGFGVRRRSHDLRCIRDASNAPLQGFPSGLVVGNADGLHKP